jgi:hypothetical protein
MLVAVVNQVADVDTLGGVLPKGSANLGEQMQLQLIGFVVDNRAKEPAVAELGRPGDRVVISEQVRDGVFVTLRAESPNQRDRPSLTVRLVACKVNLFAAGTIGQDRELAVCIGFAVPVRSALGELWQAMRPENIVVHGNAVIQGAKPLEIVKAIEPAGVA